MSIGKKLGLGTVQFGIPYGISNTFGQTPPDEVSRILKLGVRSGISLLDTACAYGNAEEVLGKNNLSPFQIVSKFPGVTDALLLKAQLQKTLSCLKVNNIYGYLAHRPLDILKNPWQWEVLGTFISQGIISKRGFSLNQPSELDALLEKGFIPDLIQVPYNYLDTRFESLMKGLKKNGCEIHSRSAFLQGLFFKDPDTLPAFFEEVKPALIKLRELKSSLPGALLKYVLEKPFIDKVIIGVENEHQLKQNLIDLEVSHALPLLDGIMSESVLMPSNWPKDE